MKMLNYASLWPLQRITCASAKEVTTSLVDFLKKSGFDLNVAGVSDTSAMLSYENSYCIAKIIVELDKSWKIRVQLEVTNHTSEIEALSLLLLNGFSISLSKDSPLRG